MRHLPTAAAIAAIAASALISGCRASPLADRFASVKKEISSARSAGAREYAQADYFGAESALSLAQESETMALDAREEAERRRHEAMLDLEELKKLQQVREEALDEAEKRRVAADAGLAAMKRRVQELRGKGVSEREIDASYGDKIAIAELEGNSARASIKTIKAELELIGVLKQEATARVASANEGIAVAGQQLLTASALCDKAGASARMAEAQAIAKRKAELNVPR